MNPIVIIAPKITRMLSIVVDITAITLYPFIISHDEMSDDVLRHETIHILQQKRTFCGILLFVVWLGLPERVYKIPK